MNKHAFDLTSFIAGAVFVTVGLVFAVATDPWNLLAVRIDWRWLGPLVLIAVGAAIVLPVFRTKPAAVAHPGQPPVDDPVLDAAHDELPPAP